MNKAIEYARDIIRKQKVLDTTTNYYIKRDYNKSIRRSARELKHYCKAKGISYEVVLSKAFIDKLP